MSHLTILHFWLFWTKVQMRHLLMIFKHFEDIQYFSISEKCRVNFMFLLGVGHLHAVVTTMGAF